MQLISLAHIYGQPEVILLENIILKYISPMAPLLKVALTSILTFFLSFSGKTILKLQLGGTTICMSMKNQSEKCLCKRKYIRNLYGFVYFRLQRQFLL